MNQLTRHSRAGGNPAKNKVPRSGTTVVPLRRDISIIWIPACAGMTQFIIMDDLP